MNDPLVLSGIAGIIVSLTGLIVGVLKVWGELKRNTVTGIDTAIVTKDTNRMVNNHADAQSVRLDRLEGVIRQLGGVVPVDPAVEEAAARVIEHGER